MWFTKATQCRRYSQIAIVSKLFVSSTRCRCGMSHCTRCYCPSVFVLFRVVLLPTGFGRRTGPPHDLKARFLGSLCRTRFSRIATTFFLAVTSAPRERIPRKRFSAHRRCPLRRTPHRAPHMTTWRIVYIVEMVSLHKC